MRRIEVPAAVRGQYREQGYWRDERLLEFVRRTVDERGDDVAVIDEQGRYTYQELWDQARRLAGWLARQGVERNTVVSAQVPNWREFAVIHLATEILGACINPLLPLYREHELEFILDACDARVFVVPERHRSRDDFVPMAARLRDKLDALNAVLVVRGDGDGAEGVERFEDVVCSDHDGSVTEEFSGDDPVIVAFTSGTEAQPKGCVHSHNTSLYGLYVVADELEMGPSDAVFMPSPLGHATGTQWGLRFAWFLGSPLVLQDRWDPAVAARLLSDHGCVYSLCATPFIRDLVSHVAASPPETYDLSRFRMVVSGGAPIPRELVREAKRHMGTDLLACYGQAECYMAVLVRHTDTEETKTSCDGWPLQGVEIRAVDEDGCDVPPGEQGECWTRGPHTMLGYVNPPDDREVFRSGDWLRTGDFVTIDQEQRLRVVGRKKEIIIRGGVNISPREIEDALLLHPDVSQVAVVGYDDTRLGERACAIVVAKGDRRLTLSDLSAFLTERGFATYKLPERLEFVDEMPMTASGKIQKPVLKTWLADRIESEGVAS